MRERTRDHSHVELLVREGVISAGQVQNHPMRNFVESCLGGEPILPEMAIEPAPCTAAGDVLLVCTDGFWANLDENRDCQRVRRRSGCRCAIRWRRSPRRRCSTPARPATIPRWRRCAFSIGLEGDRPTCIRADNGRAADALRPVRFTRRFTCHAEGSVLVEFGDTRVLCTASIEEGVPPFLRGKGRAG